MIKVPPKVTYYLDLMNACSYACMHAYAREHTHTQTQS